jgi:hypothetical protein
MLGKVETPIFILAFFYLAIVVVAVIFCVLLILSSTGVLDFVKQQHTALLTRHCGVYREQGKPSLYQGCVQQAVNYK